MRNSRSDHAAYVGIDVGAETIKLVVLEGGDAGLSWHRREIVEHHKKPLDALETVLAGVDWARARGAAITGRFSRQIRLPRIPTKVAQARAFRFLHDEDPATIVAIGSRGFSVLELRAPDHSVLRENARCSQGTGSFLRQLVERFGLSIEDASRIVEGVEEPALLSGRCPVILKTDMTHLANKGEPHASILAGLFDAVCENVQVLLKPGLCPSRVLLIGGVARSARVQTHFQHYLTRHDMTWLPSHDGEGVFVEALGCALIAADDPTPPPAAQHLLERTPQALLPRIPAVGSHRSRVTVLPAQTFPSRNGRPRRVVLGYDIGSTGSKLVALDADRHVPLWEGYAETSGSPVGAAQILTREFLKGAAGEYPVVGFGATGSGREIVSSILTSCYAPDSVFVLNEIAAHAAGALHHDAGVDTIFEIGGQDAKYIRLDKGRVIDAAMNEACSAGTGSFIAEQGGRFGDVRDVVHLGQQAQHADHGVSLGQHCSVFMAEVIDEAVAQEVSTPAIAAGIYDSVVQNYLNRVKGNRSVGDVVFCQGMPFAASALAEAVARQTGSRVVVPPNPGTIGALGIALLTSRELDLGRRMPIDLQEFLDTRLDRKETVVCRSTKGCGGSGNRCHIDRIRTTTGGRRRKFTWGGACSLYDQGTRTKKLPDQAPDPFRLREELAREVMEAATVSRGLPSIALTDEFVLKDLAPFFATFFHAIGFDVQVRSGASRDALKRGIEGANVSYCAPMQHYFGLISGMAEEGADFLFLPMLRSLPRVADEGHAVSCPISQGSSDLLRWDLGADGPRLITTRIDFGPESFRSEAFSASCARIAEDLGVSEHVWRAAFEKALVCQEAFTAQCLELGRQALDFSRAHDVVPVVVLGRPYTIYNTILNSNVPAILREQGAMPIPVDCYPVDDDVPVLENLYWGHGQRVLRAAHQVRRSPGVYSIFCSNYACGPDSFVGQFYSYLMEGEPFAMIETDGHSGDCGTRTRVEAFLYCVEQSAASEVDNRDAQRSLEHVTQGGMRPQDARAQETTILMPPMSRGAEALAAAMRRYGLQTEYLPIPDEEALRLGRRHTSGKECLPMCITIGSFIKRIEADPDPDRKFALFMPKAKGPCRLGAYSVLLEIIAERIGYAPRVSVLSPEDNDYYANVGRGFSACAVTAMVASSMLSEALYDVRPVELRAGAAEEIFERSHDELIRLIECRDSVPMFRGQAALEILSGRLFGCRSILRRAASQFAAVKGDRKLPTVHFVGEIYVRCDPFANDHLISKLEARGLKVKYASPAEWFEYTSDLTFERGVRSGLGARIANTLQHRIHETCYRALGKSLGWPKRLSAQEMVRGASRYLRRDLWGEAVLTLGGPIAEWRRGEIDGAVNVGPLECMPTRIAEAQFFHVAEQEGLKTLTLGLNGEPVDPEVLDNFAYEVHRAFERR